MAQRSIWVMVWMLAGFLAFVVTVSPAAAQSDVEVWSSLKNPMAFAVVRGRSAACEPICPEWISAEGMITADTPSTLRAVLGENEGRSLPLIISSPGGSIEAAIEMSNMIRERGLQTIVGRTYFDNGCGPGDATCRPPGGLFRGEADSTGLCHSACTIMFSGGVKRRAGQWSEVGVHTPYSPEKTVRKVYERRYKIVDGRKVPAKGRRLKKRIIQDAMTPIPPEGFTELATHFELMGVAPGIVDLFKSAGPTEMRILLQYEMRELNFLTDRGGVEALVAPALCIDTQRTPNCVTREGATVKLD